MIRLGHDQLFEDLFSIADVPGFEGIHALIAPVEIVLFPEGSDVWELVADTLEMVLQGKWLPGRFLAFGHGRDCAMRR